jgi:hypothetical protein
MQLSMVMCKCRTMYNVHCQDPARLLLQSFQNYAANTNAAPDASSKATQASLLAHPALLPIPPPTLQLWHHTLCTTLGNSAAAYTPAIESMMTL